METGNWGLRPRRAEIAGGSPKRPGRRDCCPGCTGQRLVRGTLELVVLVGVGRLRAGVRAWEQGVWQQRRSTAGDGSEARRCWRGRLGPVQGGRSEGEDATRGALFESRDGGGAVGVDGRRKSVWRKTVLDEGAWGGRWVLGSIRGGQNGQWELA
ncbi:hypothetical protein BGZ61DRAFT_215268 [Ilyonectria robusta]|uniref:uncharacterized protein n=1 Tax=Ilyonectria robusta TaxID=1079257 RepID=UPI001E8E88C9|nr:uncharacterized protein BGZ61DRAFT_215268 [Ilyonectria robusta]KAH8652945.1 hypothetical protein BGZ61DRAFT_215268 [Ilyonectria robusta]